MAVSTNIVVLTPTGDKVTINVSGTDLNELLQTAGKVVKQLDERYSVGHSFVLDGQTIPEKEKTVEKKSNTTNTTPTRVSY